MRKWWMWQRRADGSVVVTEKMGESNVRIAETFGPNKEANAALMTQSPELLAIVREALTYLESVEVGSLRLKGVKPLARRARAVLAKVSPQPSSPKPPYPDPFPTPG